MRSFHNAWPIVVIAGAAWKIADSEARLTGQLAELRVLFVDHLEDHANAR